MSIHGGDIYNKGVDLDSLLDYSSNINPLGLPKSIDSALSEGRENLLRYPDIEYRNLRSSIGKHNNISPDSVLVGNGAVELIFLFFKSLKPKKTLIVAPTFYEYTSGASSVDSQIFYFERSEESEFSLDLLRLKRYILEINMESGDTLILCNPNNPTGNLTTLSEILELNTFLESIGVILFLDECFLDFQRDFKEISAINLKSPNIFIIRAYTKFFGVPGIRLGYSLSYNSEINEKISAIREPWSVNSFAEAAGRYFLEDKEYIERTYLWIEEEKKYFYHELKKFKNVKVYQPNCNFILVKLLSTTSGNLKKKMLEKNVLIRDCSNFYGLDNTFVRLAIKDRKSNNTVIEKLKEVLGE